MGKRNDAGVLGHRGTWAVFLLTGALVALIGLPVTAYEDYVPDSGENPACSICHTCAFPTSEDLCLNKDFCLRHKVATRSAVNQGQKFMVLDEIEKVYNPVYFNHDKHAQMSEMSGGCENCHHFVPPSTGHPACKECHLPEGVRSKIQPSLKAAYHRHCLDCHSEWDTETHCEFCHRKKEGGMADHELAALPFKIHQAPLAVKDLIVFETDYEDGNKVPFHHKNHVQLYDRDCSVCHRDESCSSCHIHGTESHPLGLISDVDLHDTCYQCHDEERGCEQCHGRDSDDLFDHATVGWALAPYHKILQCNECHHDRGKYHANNPRCETCHFDGWDEEHFNHGVTGVVLDDTHTIDVDCLDCHVDGVGGPASCGECHDDGREWHRQASFGSGAEE